MALTQYKLRPSDGTAAIQQQNTQVAVGEIGASPTTEGQQLRVTATAQTQLKTVAEFENIRLISAEDGSTVRLQDVARVALGLESYGSHHRKPVGLGCGRPHLHVLPEDP